MQIDYDGIIEIIRQIEKFQKTASDKSQMEKNVHLQLALRKLSMTCDIWSKDFASMADQVTNGLIKSVLKD